MDLISIVMDYGGLMMIKVVMLLKMVDFDQEIFGGKSCYGGEVSYFHRKKLLGLPESVIHHSVWWLLL